MLLYYSSFTSGKPIYYAGGDSEPRFTLNKEEAVVVTQERAQALRVILMTHLRGVEIMIASIED